jgi:hypothetical protein
VIECFNNGPREQESVTMFLVKRTCTISEFEISGVQIYRKLSPVGMHSEFLFKLMDYSLSLNNYVELELLWDL